MLTFADPGVFGKKSEIAFAVFCVQVGRPYLDRFHAEFGVKETRQRHFQLRVWQEADALAFECGPAVLNRAGGAFTARSNDVFDVGLIDTELATDRAEPVACAMGAEREERFDPLSPSVLERHGGV